MNDLDELRAREYPALDAQGCTYLDFTAANLYATSQVERHLGILRDHLFGNPHSSNLASSVAGAYLARARRKVLEFFNASPDQWAVVFTTNASHALKLVGESYPFGPGGRYLLTFDSHSAVNAIGEFARARGATVTEVPIVLPEMRVEEPDLVGEVARAHASRGNGHNLFAYPAQSNFSGVQHPLEWIELAHAHGWDVLLDAAAFTATNRLNLDRWSPDFVVQSFYKIFGYPTGVGCLLARKSALAKLHRPWVEDETADFLAFPAVEIGFEHIESIGIDVIHKRVRGLTGLLLEQLLALRQTNGQPLIHLYGPPTTEKRGGIVTFNFYDAQGAGVDHRAVEELANRANISLRTGLRMHPESAEAVRASLGLVSNAADVARFIAFAKQFIGR